MSTAQDVLEDAPPSATQTPLPQCPNDPILVGLAVRIPTQVLQINPTIPVTSIVYETIRPVFTTHTVTSQVLAQTSWWQTQVGARSLDEIPMEWRAREMRYNRAYLDAEFYRVMAATYGAMVLAIALIITCSCVRSCYLHRYE